MATGVLRVDGTIDLAQFWPAGSSDADTSKIHVNVFADSFKFRPDPGSPFHTVTHGFRDARVKGSVTKPVIENGRVTVRLQGVDAPELHYRPQAALKKAKQSQQQRDIYLKWNLEFRQQLAETATVALASMLAQPGQDPLPCRVETAVDTPDDVFDTYGRLVGTILIPAAGDLNVNIWLLQQGWAFPAFYASMSADEIEALTAAAAAARANKSGAWSRMNRFARSRDFDWACVYRRGGQPDANADRGGKRVVMPKLFRRLSTFMLNTRAKMVKGTFAQYLAAKDDDLHLTEEFLSQGPAAAPIYALASFLNAKGSVLAKPEDLVFREKPSVVVDAAGQPVTW
jgi:endonuclease YncB( thermonuclease family)